ncbi:MAG: ribonuclease P protein component [Burkholderiales bacterium]|nr:ribonuclease P protein component [Burkholderiales bacterium]
MLPKENINNTKQIEQIFKSGHFVNSTNLTFKFFILSKNKNKRISFITPKTVSKKAVERNLLRRRGYYVLKNYFNLLPAGIMGVFIFGKKSVDIFGGLKNKKNNPISNLDKEIKVILEKI